MHPEDAAIEQFLEIKPWQYSYVERFEFYSDFGDEDEFSLNDLVVRIDLLSNTYGGNLQITFRGVRNLQLSIEGSNLQFSGGLKITSFREAQWENMRYSAEEQEGKQFSLLCRSFEAHVVERENKHGMIE